MDKILIDLFDGKIHPQAQIVANPDNPEYAALSRKIHTIEDTLKKTLDAKEQELLRELSDLYGELTSYTYKTVFVHGFKLGAQIISAACSKEIPYYRKYLDPGE